MTIFSNKVVMVSGRHLKRGDGWFVCRMSQTSEGRHFEVLEGRYRRRSYAVRRVEKLTGKPVDESFLQMVARQYDGEWVGR